MFATIGDLINYLFGVHIKFNLQTFGTFEALAFAGAYVVFVSEFKRKENDGTIQAITIKETIGEPVSLPELLANILFGFALGYKGLDVLLDLFHGEDPAVNFLSLKGNILAGCILALVWGIWIYIDRRKTTLKEPITEERLLHPYQLMPYIVVMVAVWGFIGAKLFDAVEHIQELRYVPIEVLLARSGFTYYGGLIFGAITYFYICYRHKIKLIKAADIGSPGMMLAYGIGRIGCQLSGDGDWGIINRYIKPGWVPQWAWSSTYPHNAIDAGVFIRDCAQQHCHQLPVGVYPTPLYESVFCIGLFAFMWMIRKRIKTPGTMFGLFLILNGAERFLIELLRITRKYDLLFIHLSQAQMIALLFIIGGLFVLFTVAGRSPEKILQSN
jgi:phosphatidylglycerol---prolipoprotein diacylglyceryl transferase